MRCKNYREPRKQNKLHYVFQMADSFRIICHDCVCCLMQEAYKALNRFQDCPMEFRPNYLTANTPKDIKELNWNFENFSDMLRKGINKEGKNVFEDLGYSISFFLL